MQMLKRYCRCYYLLININQRNEWIDRVNTLKQEYPLEMKNSHNILSGYGIVVLAAANCVDDEAIITTDVGQHQMWVARSLSTESTAPMVNIRRLGDDGIWVTRQAIGAALAEPNKKILCFSGDGSIMMNIQELATAAEHQLDVKMYFDK